MAQLKERDLAYAAAGAAVLTSSPELTQLVESQGASAITHPLGVANSLAGNLNTISSAAVGLASNIAPPLLVLGFMRLGFGKMLESI
ncbi:Uncharacterised protein [uncultured archaeon]|nr:Uncharacterised protein [uncultured archaeon]